jgi:hypothetical protein
MIAHIYPLALQAVSGRGYAGCLYGCFQGYQGEPMQDLGNELPRISSSRTSQNSVRKLSENGYVQRSERRFGGIRGQNGPKGTASVACKATLQARPSLSDSLKGLGSRNKP